MAGKWLNISVSVYATDEPNRWSGERGSASFEVTIPSMSVKAIDVAALLPGLVIRAQEDMQSKLDEKAAEDAAQAAADAVEAADRLTT